MHIVSRECVPFRRFGNPETWCEEELSAPPDFQTLPLRYPLVNP